MSEDLTATASDTPRRTLSETSGSTKPTKTPKKAKAGKIEKRAYMIVP